MTLHITMPLPIALEATYRRMLAEDRYGVDDIDGEIWRMFREDSDEWLSEAGKRLEFEITD